MDTPEAVERLKDVLNRPEDDDLFTDPDDYTRALERAQQHYRRQIASHYPSLLIEKKGPISSKNGDGEVYELGDEHLGEMEVWTPPGPPNGDIIPPAVPEARSHGYYVDGPKIVLTVPRDYNPGIYIRWVPATAPPVDQDNDPVLPAYMDDMLIFRAAYYMASKPGYLGEPGYFKKQAREEWEGDPESPSDAGILGTLSRQSAHHGLTTLGDRNSPWYKNIPQ